MLCRRWTRSHTASSRSSASRTMQTMLTTPPPVTAASAASSSSTKTAPATKNLIARLLRSTGLGALLQAVGGVSQEEALHLALDGAAQQHPEHAAGIDLERVGRARASATEVLELPPADERL